VFELIIVVFIIARFAVASCTLCGTY